MKNERRIINSPRVGEGEGEGIEGEGTEKDGIEKGKGKGD